MSAEKLDWVNGVVVDVFVILLNSPALEFVCSKGVLLKHSLNPILFLFLEPSSSGMCILLLSLLLDGWIS